MKPKYEVRLVRRNENNVRVVNDPYTWAFLVLVQKKQLPLNTMIMV